MTNNNATSDEKMIDIATKAYVFGYPLVLMDYTKKISCNVAVQTSVYAPVI